MALYNSHGPLYDPWVWVGDEEQVPSDTSFIVSASRFLETVKLLLMSDSPIGVWLTTEDQKELIEPYADKLKLIALEFIHFKDGRSFSMARVLRERSGFDGELRAFGDLLPDQASFLVRSGFDTFEIPDTFSQESVCKALNSYTVWYQFAADKRKTAPVLRHWLAEEAGT